MNEGSGQGGEGPTTTGAKPTIGEVAAWLRRAAEQRDDADEPTPWAARAPDAPAVESPGPDVGASAGADETAVEAPADAVAPPEAFRDDQPDEKPEEKPEEPAAAVVEEGPRAKEERHDPAAGGTRAGGDEAPAAPASRPDDGPDRGPVGLSVGEPSAVTAPTDDQVGPAPADLDLRERTDVDADRASVEPLPEPGPGIWPFGVGEPAAEPADMSIDTFPGTHDREDITADDDERGVARAPVGATVASTNVAGTGEAGPDSLPVGSPAEGKPDDAQDLAPAEALVEDDPWRLADHDHPATDPQPAPAPSPRAQDHSESHVDAEDPPSGSAAPAPASVSLFDLHLTELAARARAAGERGEPAGRSDPLAPAAATSTIEVDEPEHPIGFEVDDLEAEATAARPDLTRDDDEDLADDADAPEIEDADATKTPAKAAATALAMVAAAIQRRTARRNRYPRGQLKERIGVLRRVRAMLGVVMVTIVLGVAAGAAIGACIVFVAFALRKAITSG